MDPGFASFFFFYDKETHSHCSLGVHRVKPPDPGFAFFLMFHFSHDLILLTWHLHVVCIPSFLRVLGQFYYSKNWVFFYDYFALLLFLGS